MRGSALMRSVSAVSDFVYYLLPLFVITFAMYLHLRMKKNVTERHVEALEESLAAGLMEPPSLHPVIDHALCFGSGACVRACPEKALGIIKGKGVLVNPSHCIGHGACAAACPADAIHPGEHPGRPLPARRGQRRPLHDGAGEAEGPDHRVSGSRRCGSPVSLRRYLPILDWGSRYGRETLANDLLAAVMRG